jgi:hypothetical protein
MPSRWFLLFLVIALLLTLSCSQGTSPFYPGVPNASLFFDRTASAEYVVNGGSGTAYDILIAQFNGSTIFNSRVDSLVSTARASFQTQSPRDSVVATWKNPNGTPGRVKGT